MLHVALPDGEKVPALGLGTWRMGETGDPAAEAEVLRAGLDLGLSVFDTAEMYGEGGAERVLARALDGRRDEAFIVSKVYPHNATREGTVAACERSLKRLATDRIDLYLLHWPGATPVTETIEAFETLKQQGKIRHWGVSNFDAAGMDEIWSAPHGTSCAVNQVLYNLSERGIEWQLKPALDEKNTPVMAYCPLGEGRLLHDAALATLADRHGVQTASIALAWLLQRGNVMAIPKTSRRERLDAVRAALDIRLDDEDLKLLDDEFPPPDGPMPLSIT